MKIDYLKNLNIQGFEKILNWDGSFGMVKNTRLSHSDSPFGWWIASAKLSNNPVGSVSYYSSNSSAGSSIYAKTAIASAMGEAIERYCLTNGHAVDHPRMQPFDNKLEFVRCAAFEKAPANLKINRTSENIEHTKVKELTTGKSCYVPFEFIHLGFRKNNETELLTQPISTGCAFYPDKNTAIIKGIYEVIERDALMRFWYSEFESALKIDLNDINDFDSVIRIKKIQYQNVKLHLFEISSVVPIPVVFCVLENTEYPYYVCGASCNVNRSKALIKSIDEAVAIFSVAKYNKQKNDFSFDDFFKIQKLEEHMELYAHWKNCPIFKKLIMRRLKLCKLNSNTDSLPIKENPVDLSKTLNASGFNAYYKDISLPEISSVGYVVKVIIPKMIPLSQCYHSRWLNGLYKNSSSVPNPFPQPFS